MDQRADSPGPDVNPTPLLSVVIPVRNEADNVIPTLEGLCGALALPAEILIVYDDDSDSTLPVVASFTPPPNITLRTVQNRIGRGPGNAIRAGFAAAEGDAVMVMMADRSDDLRAIASMLEKFGDGYDLVCASRYMRGGEQVGGPWLKGMLSRMAGLSLHAIGLPTHDPTNSFKLYRRARLNALAFEPVTGFEINLQIMAKAVRGGWRITEVPSRWEDRVAGSSKFKLWKWLPLYLRWYFNTVAGVAFARRKR